MSTYPPSPKAILVCFTPSPYVGRGARPYSKIRGTVKQMAGTGLPERMEKVAEGACPVPTLPSLSLSRPQATALPAPQSQHLSLETLLPFQAWSSSLAFTLGSPSQTSPFPSPSCCVLRVQRSQQVSFSEPRLSSAEWGSLPPPQRPIGLHHGD